METHRLSAYTNTFNPYNTHRSMPQATALACVEGVYGKGCGVNALLTHNST